MRHWKFLGFLGVGILVLGSIIVGFAVVGSELYRMATPDRQGTAGPGALVAADDSGDSHVRGGNASNGQGGEAKRGPTPPLRGDGEPIFAQVVTAEGDPIPGVAVHLGQGGNPPFEEIRALATDELGIAEFAGLDAQDRYSVHVDHPPFVPLASSVVQPGERVVFRMVEGATLSGTVADASTGEVLGGALVYGTTRALDPVRWNEIVVTGDDGRYSFRAVPDEPLLVRFMRDGFQSHEEKDVRAPLGQPTVLDASLIPGVPVTGWVLDAQTRDPIAGAEVSCGVGVFEEKNLARTDDRGKFTLRGLGRERISIHVRAPGYAPGSANLDLRGAGGERTLEIALERWGGVEGIVRSMESGKPVAGAEVFVESDAFLFNKKSERLGVTGQDGTFRIRLDGATGTVRIGASHPDYMDGLSVPLDIASGGPVPRVEILLPVGGSIEGTVVDEAGKPIQGAVVELYEEFLPNPDNPAYRPEAQFQHHPRGRRTHASRTESDGGFVFRGVEPGQKMLQVQSDGLLTARLPGIYVSENEAIGQLEIVLAKGQSLAGTVVDSSGAPIDGVRVSAVRPAGTREGSTAVVSTDTEGNFVLTRLEPGVYDVFATKGGFVRYQLRAVAAGTQDLRITLDRYGGVSGIVSFVTAPEAVPPSKFTVVLESADGADWPPQRKSFSSQEGSFLFETVPPGIFDLVVSAQGFATRVVMGVRVVQDVVTEGIQVLLDTGAGLQGRVYDDGGRPAGGATVFVRPIEGYGDVRSAADSSVSARCDSAGNYSVSGLTGGVYEAFAAGGMLVSSEPVRVTVAEGSIQTLDLRVTTGGELRIRVSDPEGAPVSGVALELTREDGTPIRNPRSITVASQYSDDPEVARQALARMNRTDVTGFLLVPSVPAGTILVRVGGDGYRSASSRVSVTPGEATTVELVVEPR